MDFHESIENADKFAEVFLTLANSHRLQVLSLLAEDGPISAGEILNSLDELTQADLSSHLKKLVQCGMVDFHKDHKYRYYYICDPSVLKILESTESAQLQMQSDSSLTNKPKNNDFYSQG